MASWRLSARCRAMRQPSRRKRSHVYRLLCALNWQIPEVSDLTLLLESVAKVAHRTLDPTGCVIWLREDAAGQNEAGLAWVGVKPPSCLADHNSVLWPQRRVFSVTELQNTPLHEALLEAGMNLVISLIYQGEVIGWLGVGPPRRRQIYTREERCFLEILADQTAMRIVEVRLRARLETSITQLRQAYQQIICAQETERRQLAETLHDETLQHLADLSVRLGLLHSQSEINSVDLEDLQMRLARTDHRLREIVRGVHPAILSDLGLIEAVIAFLESLSLNTPVSPIRVELRVTGFKEQRLPDQHLELALYRFAQNATTNALTHGQPGHIRVEFNWGIDAVEVRVKDDGCGMNTTVEEAARAGHFGLLTMRERIEALGGKFVSSSRPGRGTQVSGSIPLAIPSPAPEEVELYLFEFT